MLGVNDLNLYKFKVLSLLSVLSVLSVFLVMAFWLITTYNLNAWQQVLLEKTIENAPSNTLNKNVKIKAALLPDQSIKSISNKGKPLVLANVDLPELPKTAINLTIKSEIPPKLSEQEAKYLLDKKQANLSGKPPNKLPNNLPNKSPRKTVSKTLSKVAQKPEVQAVTKAVTKVVSKESTSAIYQQLISDHAINIELAWSNESSARQRVFAFLYQCMGMKFGVLNNQKVTLAKTSYQYSNNLGQSSEWLRIAQGQLSNQERLWLQQYNLTGTPVRLFPKVADWQLAKLITDQLNGQALKSLRAHYKYENQRLLLRDISLNGQRLNKSWLLIESECSVKI